MLPGLIPQFPRSPHPMPTPRAPASVPAHVSGPTMSGAPASPFELHRVQVTVQLTAEQAGDVYELLRFCGRSPDFCDDDCTVYRRCAELFRSALDAAGIAPEWYSRSPPFSIPDSPQFESIESQSPPELTPEEQRAAYERYLAVTPVAQRLPVYFAPGGPPLHVFLTVNHEQPGQFADQEEEASAGAAHQEEEDRGCHEQ